MVCESEWATTPRPWSFKMNADTHYCNEILSFYCVTLQELPESYSHSASFSRMCRNAVNTCTDHGLWYNGPESVLINLWEAKLAPLVDEIEVQQHSILWEPWSILSVIIFLYLHTVFIKTGSSLQMPSSDRFLYIYHTCVHSGLQMWRVSEVITASGAEQVNTFAQISLIPL